MIIRYITHRLTATKQTYDSSVIQNLNTSIFIAIIITKPPAGFKLVKHENDLKAYQKWILMISLSYLE